MRYFLYKRGDENVWIYETNQSKTQEHQIWDNERPRESIGDGIWRPYYFDTSDDIEEIEITEEQAFLYML